MRHAWILLALLGISGLTGCQPAEQARGPVKPAKPVLGKPEEPATAETPKPADTSAEAAAAKPAEPMKAEPSSAKPADASKPAEPAKAETKPADAPKPAEPAKAETKPADAPKPTEVAMAKPVAPAPTGGKIDGPWGTIKGRVVWSGAELPKVTDLEVTKDQDHCLSKGPLKAEDPIVVNPATKGVLNIIAYLKKPASVHPSLTRSPEELTAAVRKQVEELNGINLGDEPDFDVALRTAIAEGKVTVKDLKAPAILDQVLCIYTPHALAVQEGMPLVIKNPEPIPHNVKIGDFAKLNESNDNMPPNTLIVKTLKATNLPVTFECSIHPWMKMSAMVLDHPYYAVTNENGEFEIALVPAGELTLHMRGAKYIDAVKGGKGTSKGATITVKAGEVLDLGEIKVDETYAK